MADRSAMEGPRALQPHEHDSAIELINRILRPGRPGTALQEYPLVLGKENLPNMRGIVHDGRVVSHATVYFSRLRTDSISFRIGGISSVATDPAYRGQGFGSAVIKDCLNIISEAGCDFSVLWTQRHDFYRNLGFEPAGSEYLFQFNAAAPSSKKQTCAIVPYSPLYLPEIIKIHEREPYRTERSQLEYEMYFSLPKTKTLLALRGGEVTAYAVMGKGEDFRNCVHEWGGVPNDLIWLVRKLALETGLKEILVLAPTTASEFTELLHRMRLPEISEPLAMMKIINLKSMESKINTFLDRRLERRLEILEDGRQIAVRLDNQQAHLAHERMLARLLFGPDHPSHLLAGASEEMLRALEKVLPMSLFIWGLDSV